MTAARREGRLTVIDWVMLALALCSVTLLAWVTFWDVTEATAWRVFWTDVGISALFAGEFTWRWWREGWDRWYPLAHWYELAAMLPVSHPLFAGELTLRIGVLLARVGSAADRAFGRRFTAQLVAQGRGAIIEAVKRPITVAVLDEVVDVLQTGHYSRNAARALEENREELRAMILEKIKEDRRAGSLAKLPFHDDVVLGLADTTLRVLHDVLHDPRTDELIGDMLRENVEQIREAVRGRYEPLGPSGYPVPHPPPTRGRD